MSVYVGNFYVDRHRNACVHINTHTERRDDRERQMDRQTDTGSETKKERKRDREIEREMGRADKSLKRLRPGLGAQKER